MMATVFVVSPAMLELFKRAGIDTTGYVASQKIPPQSKPAPKVKP